MGTTVLRPCRKGPRTIRDGTVPCCLATHVYTSTGLRHKHMSWDIGINPGMLDICVVLQLHVGARSLRGYEGESDPARQVSLRSPQTSAGQLAGLPARRKRDYKPSQLTKSMRLPSPYVECNMGMAAWACLILKHLDSLQRNNRQAQRSIPEQRHTVMTVEL